MVPTSGATGDAISISRCRSCSGIVAAALSTAFRHIRTFHAIRKTIPRPGPGSARLLVLAFLNEKRLRGDMIDGLVGAAREPSCDGVRWLDPHLIRSAAAAPESHCPDHGASARHAVSDLAGLPSATTGRTSRRRARRVPLARVLGCFRLAQPCSNCAVSRCPLPPPPSRATGACSQPNRTKRGNLPNRILTSVRSRSEMRARDSPVDEAHRERYRQDSRLSWVEVYDALRASPGYPVRCVNW